jgi:hypothetical protein
MPLSESHNSYKVNVLFSIQSFQIRKSIVTENNTEIPLAPNAKYSNLQPLHDMSGTSVNIV